MAISQNFPSVRPSLDLNFAGTKKLDSRITFSRGSVGTYYDSTGTIQTAAPHVARFDHDPVTGESLGLLVEEARTNRTVRSQRLGLSTGNWFTYKADCIDNAGLAPDGTFTAARFVPNTENLIHYVADGTGASLSGTATISVFAKNDGYNFFGLAFDYASGDGLFPGSAQFDLSTGQISLGASTTGSIQQLPNGWYRCTITATVGSTVQANPYIYASPSLTYSSFAGNGTSGILLWGFQFESGSFPTTYIPTPATFTGRSSTATFYDSSGIIRTAASGVARSAAFFPDSSGVMRPAGLLLEAAGTNLVTYSEQFDNAVWTKSGTTISANSTTAPDGTTTADTVIASAGSGYKDLYQTFTSSASANTTYTFSVFVKANGIQFFTVVPYFNGGSYASWFDLTSGTTLTNTSGNTSTITKLANGWYRCTVTRTSPATLINAIFIVRPADANGFETYTGNGSNGFYVWGAQVEQNSYATSYIPTTTATVTRAADTSTSSTVTRNTDSVGILGTNFSSWYRQDAGTVFIEYRRSLESNTTYPTPWTIRDSIPGAYTNGIQIYGEAGNTYDRLGGTNISSTPSVSLPNPRGRLDKNAAAFTNGSLNMAVNGTLGTPSTNNIYTSGTVNRLEFSSSSSYTFKRFTYWPARLSDTFIQQITR